MGNRTTHIKYYAVIFQFVCLYIKYVIITQKVLPTSSFSGTAIILGKPVAYRYMERLNNCNEPLKTVTFQIFRNISFCL